MPFTKDRSIFVNRRWIEVKDYPGHSFVTTLGGTISKLTRTRTGESVKDYKTLIAQQKNATSNMNGTFDTMDLSDAYRRYLFRFLDFNDSTPNPDDVYFVDVQGILAPSVSLSNPLLGLGVATNRAAIAFLKHARSVQSEFSSPIFLGELKETLQMIRSPAKGLRNLAGSYLSKVKNSKKKSPKNWKKNLSSLWLEQAFGWQPLINDIKEGYKAYSGLVKERDGEQVLVSGYGIEEKEVGQVRSDPYYFGSGGFLRGGTNYVTKDKAFVKYYGAVTRRVDVTLRERLGRVGFNAEEFVPTVWELLPWSFLVDYFSNIGDVLTSNAFNRADLAWVSNVAIQFRDIYGTFWLDHDSLRKQYPKHYVASYGDPGRWHFQRRIVNRTKSVGVPFPSLSLELPGAPAQFANMLALFTQANSIHPQHYRFKPR